MQTVLLTGAKGTIGTALRNGLEEKYQIRQFDMSEHDACNYDQVALQMLGCAAVIHLAWDTTTEHFRSNHTNPHNLQMANNVYRAAAEVGTKRLIMASSIHADMPLATGKLRPPDHPYPQPDSPYGQSKLAVEQLGRKFAVQNSLQVICVRFGWVSPREDQRPPTNEPYPANEGWLSHGDCVRLVDTYLSAPTIPDNFQIIWGLSRRQQGGIHDLSNQLWTPQDSYDAPLPPER